MKNLLEVCRIGWIKEWYYVHLHLRFILTAEHSNLNGYKWCLMNSNWWTVVSGVCTLICCHMPYASSKVTVVLCLNGYWLYTWQCVKWLMSFKASLSNCLGILQLEQTYVWKETICAYHIPWILVVFNDPDAWTAFKLCLFLLWTLFPCRFLFHIQDMILTRSYYILSTLATASVDGCCLYIMIHSSVSYRTWL